MTKPGIRGEARRTWRTGAIALVLAAGAIATGCDDEKTGAPGGDAGGGVDAGTEVDAGPIPGGDAGGGDSSAPPVPDAEEGPGGFTLYVAPNGMLTVYWFDADDDETAAAALEYRVVYRFAGSPATTVLDFTESSAIAHEAQGRMFVHASSAGTLQGTHEVTVSVRDEDGNVVDYPVLTHVVAPCQVCAIQPPRSN